MEIKFCIHTGCGAVAIGVPRWDPDLRPVRDHCREHYLSDVMGDTAVRCEVVGPFEVTDVRTQEGVAKGGVVELDPLQTNIPLLVYAGHVRQLPPPTASTAARAMKAEAKPEGKKV